MAKNLLKTKKPTLVVGGKGGGFVKKTKGSRKGKRIAKARASTKKGGGSEVKGPWKKPVRRGKRERMKEDLG